MNHNPIIYFEEEINKIKDSKTQDLVEKVLAKVPPYFMEKPASSGGKYHPAFSNTHTGLAKHTRAAFYFGQKLCEVYSLDQLETDAALAAILLHDVCKYGLPGGNHTVSDHDVIGAAFIKKIADMTDTKPKLLKEIILSVAYHYGPWTKRDDPAMLRKFPEDYSKIMQVTHIADVMSACKEIRLNFLEENLIG